MLNYYFYGVNKSQLCGLKQQFS